MAKIIGGTVATPMPRSDWNQQNPNRADYIKNKPFEKVDDKLSTTSNNPVQNNVVAQAIADMQPVRFTVTKQDGEYVSSKTYEELTAILAENEHRSIICEIDGYDVPLCKVTRLALSFVLVISTWHVIHVQLASNGDTTRVTVIRDYPSIEINGQLWDEEDPNADFTDTINAMIDDALKESGGGTVAVPTDYVTPQMFGAKGDGKTDDTKAIQDAMDANYTAYAPDGTKMTVYYPVYIPAGTYLVNGEYSGYTNPHMGGIKLHSGQRVYMDADCEIKVFGNGPDGWITTGFSNAFSVYQCENVEIHGGKIVGGTVRKYYQGAYYDPDWVDPNNQNDRILPVQCYGIDVIASENVLIDNVDISEMRGDAIVVNGIYVTVDGKTVCQSEYSNRITIQNCHLHDCARQGISMLAGNNATISNNTIHDIWGNAPKGGIDIEPLDDCDDVHDIIVENCRIYDCGQSFCFSKCHDVVINNCTMSGKWVLIEEKDENGNVVSVYSEVHGGVVAVHDAYNVKFNNCTLNKFDNAENCDVSFYGCNIALAYHNAPKSQPDECVSHYYDCHFSGERTGTDGYKRAVVTGAGEMYFKNCEFALEGITGSDVFIFGTKYCRFDGCSFVTIGSKKLPRFSNACNFEFNGCQFDVSFSAQHLFLNPAKLVMQGCYIKTDYYVIMYSGAVDNSQILASGNIFDCAYNPLYIADNVTIATPSITLLNNTLVNSTRTFVRNKGTDPITVTDINNNKI